MDYEIRFSKRSIKELQKTVEYLIDNWSVKTVDEFLDKFYSKINNISRNPFSYSKTVFGKNIRRCVITKHVTLYYKTKIIK